MRRIPFALSLSLLAAAAATAAEPPAPRLDVLTAGYPRAFFFRHAEGFAVKGRVGYEEWQGMFDRLMGFIGKAMDEERIGCEQRNPAFFTRFKADHPRQLVLVHINGNARDPRYQREAFFAGHWAYHPPATILADVPAEAGETDIRVDDARRFRTGMGRYRTSSDDVGLCLRTPAGRLDWHRSEQVKLVAADVRRGVVRVRRGCYGTKPRAFPAGSAAAVHATEGPWGRRNHLLWYYNYSTRCPADAAGRRCWEVLADDIARQFAPGGRLAALDGMEFDVLYHRRGGAGPRRALDCDADGGGDNGVFGGVNTYGLGVLAFLARLRERLPGKLLLADGHNERHQRGFGVLNGIESEGWPDLRDHTVEDWSGGINRHAYWNAHGARPTFHYINHKYILPTGSPGVLRRPDVPWRIHRLVFAASVFTDAAVTYAYLPPPEPGERIGIWDELCMGRARRVGWLGRPKGPAVRLAMRAPDLLAGRGTAPRGADGFRWAGEGVRFGRTADGLTVTAADPNAAETTFRLLGVPCDGPDLFLRVTLAGEAQADYPPQMPRLVHVCLPADERLLTRVEPPPTAMRLRGRAAGPLDPETGAKVRTIDRYPIGGERRRAVFTHPPYRGTAGWVAWWRDVTVPEAGRLRMHLGMGPKSPEKSDGVVFRVELAELAAGGEPDDDAWKPIFRHTQTAHQWTPHDVDLSRWAGRRVRLRFVADCGPADHCITDHSYWGDVRVVGAGADGEPRPARRIMTWAGPKAFASGFAFDVGEAQTVDLTFTVEGGGAVRLEAVTAHAAPDAMARVFENGVVLANPSPRRAAFDLAALTGGRRCRRLRGSSQQDSETNNGEAAGGQVALGAKDALFLTFPLTPPAGAR